VVNCGHHPSSSPSLVVIGCGCLLLSITASVISHCWWSVVVGHDCGRCQWGVRCSNKWHAMQSRVHTRMGLIGTCMRWHLLAAPSRFLLHYMLQLGSPWPILLVDHEDALRTWNQRCRGCGWCQVRHDHLQWWILWHWCAMWAQGLWTWKQLWLLGMVIVVMCQGHSLGVLWGLHWCGYLGLGMVHERIVVARV